ncbi:uncharacterized protein LOC123547183 [Mercenaria mercenaria]|uniref:uncharacterized protein LOC123547183 n=1 Tax=Mercenaria mercenaria TaxID=6596 RepID=UPI00234F3099|nr:uncharacterized protein LOC123547183 [Mercenaria mercenaria]
MKSLLCAYSLFSLLLTGSAQQFNRPHPLYSRQQEANNNALALALLFGLDFNEYLAFQATNNRPGGFGNFGLGNLGLGNFGLPLHPRARQRATQNLNALSALGIIDGPDLPDGPAGGRGKGRRGGPKRAGAKGGAGAAGGEAPEGAPAKKKPRRRGPRRKAASKAANAKK